MASNPLLARTFVLGLALIVSSCGTVERRYGAEVVDVALNKADGDIHFSGSGNWYANFKGFSLLHPLPRFTPGIIVITDNSLTLNSRATASLVRVMRVTIDELDSVDLASFGLNRRIVLCNRDLRCDSFDFTKTNTDVVDRTKVEEAAAFLRSRLNGHLPVRSSPDGAL